ncbi:MAG: serine/threonine-protein kinase [Mycobacterium sp.]
MSPRVGTRFGKYEIIRLLGRGGMGEVYEARDTEKGRTVALKILVDQFSKDDAYRTRFTREAHAAAQLQEPHVIPIHDWGEIEGSLFMDMRLVRGTDLRRLLNAGPLEPARAVNIISQVASALDAAHADELMHRDIKPENIVVTADDFAYLVDFGIAEKAGDSRLTQADLTVGSLAYIAPERLADQPTTPAADTYSLACVLYESLTCQTPFGKSGTEQLLSGHLYAPPPRPSTTQLGVPAAFDEVIARGMAKDPTHRYESAGAFARAASGALLTPTAVIKQSDVQTTDNIVDATDVHPRTTPSTPTQSAPLAQTQSAPMMATQMAPYQPQTPPTGPPGAPQNVYWYGQQPPQQQPQQQKSNSWLVPTVIAVCAALLLAVVGVTVVVLTGQEPSDRTTSSGRTTAAGMANSNDDDSDSDITTERTTTTTTTTRQLVPPPLVRGLDPNQESCDDGIQYAGATGPGSRGARGSTQTTCFFVRNVLSAYWEAGRPTSAPRTVYAVGSVSCQQTAGQCVGDKFVMQCATFGSEDWITCTGGSNARVYIY